MAIVGKKLNDYEKAKILLEDSGDMFRVNKIIPFYITSYTTKIDYETPGRTETELSIVIFSNENGEYLELDPNKQYILGEI